MPALKRITLGPKSVPQGIMGKWENEHSSFSNKTLVEVFHGPVNEFAEMAGTEIRTFRVLPGGDLWLMEADYVLSHVYRRETITRYYTTRDTWIENGVEIQERPYALTT